MKKKIIYINLALIVIFGFKLYLLRSEIVKGHDSKESSPQNSRVEIKRIDYGIPEKFRNIFGIKPVPKPEKINEDEKLNNSLSGDKNELFTKKEILRLRGIFISGGAGYAVISVEDKQTKNEEYIRLGKNDKFRNFTVYDVLSNSIVLDNPSTGKISLKIFRADPL